jgi:predicted Zn-dependent protease
MFLGVLEMKDLFYSLAEHVQSQLSGSEVYTLVANAERSDFVRFNKAKVRQPGSVVQYNLKLKLIDGRKHSSVTVGLCGEPKVDRKCLTNAIQELRAQLPYLPEDPHLLFNTDVQNSEVSSTSKLIDTPQMVDSIVEQAKGTDLVGVLAAGSIYSGFANSFGQRNWFSNHNFNFDWSLVESTDKAVKSSYAGEVWDGDLFANKMMAAKQNLSLLKRPSITIEPGKYRAYLTPVALWEILQLLGWGAFSIRSQKNKTTPLLQMINEEKKLSPLFTLSENIANGVAPGFQSDGFKRPNNISLIKNGLSSGALISPRSAKEFSLDTNGASMSESPDSLEVETGDLNRSTILSTLDTGVFISNLWYLNYSDRSGGRMTGMTRFATFWVENGKIIAPLKVMRFDDTIYNMLGENLQGLTSEQDLLLSASSYFQRSTNSARLPGALINDFRFTL